MGCLGCKGWGVIKGCSKFFGLVCEMSSDALAADGLTSDGLTSGALAPSHALGDRDAGLGIQALAQDGIALLRDRLRPGQQQMADWAGGELAVSAVPGAGKSTGMATAAAIAIARYGLHPRRQLVLVTFTRSAATNLKAKIRGQLRALDLPMVGFSVHTLHGLALTIASRHPERSQLDLGAVSLVSPTQGSRLVRSCVEQWISDCPQRYQRLIEGRSFDGEEAERLRRQSVLRTEVLPELAMTVIHEAKSSGLGPSQLEAGIGVAEAGDGYEVLRIGAGLYERYQKLLGQRGWIDYDDMILAALRALADSEVRSLWQRQVFAVFEDEAQDSTPLQSQLLTILAQDPDRPLAPANLVRVGDPNQAINSTFTPADPIFFRRFCDRAQARNALVTMDQAGRSSPVIIDAANFVLDWVNRCYQGLPFRSQHIRPVPLGDPQPDANPAPEGLGLELVRPEDIGVTVQQLQQRLGELFERDPQTQAAILVRENRQGRWLAEQMADWQRDRGIAIYEVGRSDRHSHVPLDMLTLLQFIQRPHSPDYLKAALTLLMRRQLIPSQDLNPLVSLPEQFLYPGPLAPPQTEPIRQARRFCAGLLQARIALPPLQFIAFVALSLGYDATELATADKLADQAAQRTQGNLTLPNVLAVLADIVSAERFEPVDPEATDSRYTRPGQITIITMHKAKGLDWDYVFIPFLQAQTMPGQLRVPPQASFLGDYTLAEVARAQIRAYLHGGGLATVIDGVGSAEIGVKPLDQLPDQLPALETPEAAWQRADQLKAAEEFRLLYVAMTRAKRLLWMSAERKAPFTWAKPGHWEERSPCPAFTALLDRFPQAQLGS